MAEALAWRVLRCFDLEATLRGVVLRWGRRGEHFKVGAAQQDAIQASLVSTL